jgi:hypothetical protein
MLQFDYNATGGTASWGCLLLVGNIRPPDRTLATGWTLEVLNQHLIAF